MSADDVNLALESANDPPRQGSWVCATLQCADGSIIELYLPHVVAGAVSGYSPEPGEVPVIAYTDSEGVRRRGRLTQLFGPQSLPRK